MAPLLEQCTIGICSPLSSSASLRALVGDAEVGEQSLGLQVGKGARLADLIHRGVVARERLAHKADAAHARVALDMDFADAAVLGALCGKRLGVVERENRLRNIILRQPLRVAHRGVAQNQDRQLHARGTDLDALVDIAHGKKVGAQLLVNAAQLLRTVTVAVRLDDAADFGAAAHLLFDLVKIVHDGVQ